MSDFDPTVLTVYGRLDRAALGAVENQAQRLGGL